MFIIFAMRRPQVKGIIVVTKLLALKPCDGLFASASMQDTARYQPRENGLPGRKTFSCVPHLDYRLAEPAAARVGPWRKDEERRALHDAGPCSIAADSPGTALGATQRGKELFAGQV